MTEKKLKVLAASSGGGHWEQLMAMRGAFEGCDIVFATTIPGLLANTTFGGTSASRLQPRLDYHVDPVLFHRLLHRHQAEAGCHHLDRCRTRPFCLLAGKLTGKRTIWIDSVANVEKLSLSGKLAGHIATLWLTQWQHLSRPDGPHYAGAVL